MESQNKEFVRGRSLIEFLAAALGSVYSVYLIKYFYFLGDDLASTIATLIVTPHIVLCVLGSIFMWIGFFDNGKITALVGAILFSVAGAIFMTYLPLCIPIIILGFIGWRMICRIRTYYEYYYEDAEQTEDETLNN